MASPSPSSSSVAGAGAGAGAASPALALPPPPPPPKPSSRRLPPPCWSHEETLALIAAYADKWHSLGRGNLRASHWDDVSSSVARDCPSSSKTSVQCRHKIEKLRKRYRSEKPRSLSSWLYFPKMDAMECGAAAGGLRFTIPKAVRSKMVGFRPSPKMGLEEMRRRVEEKRMRMAKEEDGDEDGIEDVAAALGFFGEGFLKMEHMKMDVSREVEKMRMEMELKRTEMVLDCQRQIVETMVHRFMGN